VGREELAPAGTREPDDVLEVGRRGSDRPRNGWRERPSRTRDGAEEQEPRSDLEPPRRDVVMRDAVSERVEEQPDGECTSAAPRERPGCRSGPDVHRDDHGARLHGRNGAAAAVVVAGVDEAVRRALERDRTIDITTIGRKSGREHRIETWFYRVDGRLYLSGSPGRRDWLANLRAHPEFTFHLKQSVRADLPARAHPIDDPAERRRVMLLIRDELGRTSGLDDWIARSPLVEVELLPYLAR
jgi:hypothetical protein